MKIKMLVSIAGPDYSANVGDELDLPDDEATRLLEADPAMAIPVAKPVTESRQKAPSK